MVLKGEEGLECEAHIDRIHLEHVSEFKYLGCVFGTDEVECSRKVISGRMVAGAIRSLVNARHLQLEFARVLHTILLVSVLYGSETILLNKKERSRIRAVWMGNFRGLLVIRRMDRIPNAQIRQF